MAEFMGGSEAVAIHDTRLDAGLITVAKQLVVNGWEVYEDAPQD